MNVEVNGPFVVVSKTDDAISSLDELNPNFVLFKTEDGTLLSLKEGWGSAATGGSEPERIDQQIVLEFLDPKNEILLNFFTIRQNVYEQFLKNYSGGSGPLAVADDQVTFFIHYGVGRFKKHAPVKKVRLNKVEVITDYDETYKVRVTFTLEPSQMQNVPSSSRSTDGIMGDISMTNFAASQNVQNAGSLTVFPNAAERGREYSLWKAKYRNIPTGSIPYLTNPSIGPIVDNYKNRMNIVSLLEMMFQDFLVTSREGTQLPIGDAIPIVMLPSCINAKMVEAIRNSFDSEDDFNEEGAQIAALTTILQNAGFIVSKTITGWSMSVGAFGETWIMNMNLGFEYDPGVSRLLVVKNLINSLLIELGLGSVSYDPVVLSLTDSVVCDKFGSLMLNGTQDNYVTNALTGEKGSNIKLRTAQDKVKHGFLVICDKALQDLINPSPDDFVNNYAVEVKYRYIDSAREYINSAEPSDYSNHQQFLQGAVSYIEDIAEHYAAYDLQFVGGFIPLLFPTRELNSTIEVYEVGSDQDDVLNFKIANKQQLPYTGGETVYDSIAAPMLRNPANYLNALNIPNNAPLTGDKINFIMNRLVKDALNNSGPALTAALEIINPEQLVTRYTQGSGIEEVLNLIASTYDRDEVSVATILDYANFLRKVNGTAKQLVLTVKPEFRKYAAGINKYVLFRVL